MKRILLPALLLVGSLLSSCAPGYVYSSSGGYSGGSGGGTGRCYVNGYTRKDGTYVSGYWRSC